MIPTIHDWDEFYELVKPYAQHRVTVHFGGDPTVSVLGHGKRQSSPGSYVVWIGNRYAKSDKTICHAARQVIKQYGGNE